MQLMLLLLLLVAIVSCVQVEQICPHCTPCDYKYCAEGMLPVGCIKPTGFSDKCGASEHIFVPVDSQLREEILLDVNMLRARLASGLFNSSTAGRMTTMMWDPELAHAAKVLIQECDHSKICSNSAKYNYVATVEMSGGVRNSQSISEDFLRIILPEWLSDVNGCNLNIREGVTRKGIEPCVGHYIPLIQDRGNRMGCAMRLDIAAEPVPDGDEIANNRLVVICNLSRAHVNDMPHYEVSLVPGQECETGRHPFFEFLCDVNEEIDPNYVEPFGARVIKE
ncbi:uncharacterized protein LOC133841171 [Drosophila sulfurigaster albostrigata]|uniref:uncharacterized protein LOC133841171 n=1 Tax=Drosophila sulfurigaster albostrigata TaxID=89887 RepID=UPI002D21B18E|nr:uncharacterized protein LOC133841171 [Drosophila sulfurigaster albostrigata]